MKKNNRGFTLIELLVVIAIIGLLSTLAVVALNNAREKSRDARRVADVKQVQTALELYFNDCGAYPDMSGGLLTTIGNGCTGGETFGDYMSVVPQAPTPPAGNVYAYADNSAATGSYVITYTIEGVTGGIPAGAHNATPAGIQNP